MGLAWGRQGGWTQPLFGEASCREAPSPATVPHSHRHSRQVPTTCPGHQSPPPQEPELALGKAGAGPHEESRSTLHPPSLPPPWGTHGPWGGDAAQAIRDAVLLWQTGLSGGSVCVCVGGVLCFSVSNSCQSRGTVSENTKVLI